LRIKAVLVFELDKPVNLCDIIGRR
jgi:hypothetical protein